jgi:hypothetical protein
VVDRGDRTPTAADGRDAEDTERDAGTGLACGSAGDRVPDARSRLRRRTPPCHANRPERPISAGSSAGGHPSHRVVRARGHSLRQITFTPCAAPRCRMRSSGRRFGGCVRKRRRPHDDRHSPQRAIQAACVVPEQWLGAVRLDLGQRASVGDLTGAAPSHVPACSRNTRGHSGPGLGSGWRSGHHRCVIEEIMPRASAIVAK